MFTRVFSINKSLYFKNKIRYFDTVGLLENIVILSVKLMECSGKFDPEIPGVSQNMEGFNGYDR